MVYNNLEGVDEYGEVGCEPMDDGEWQWGKLMDCRPIHAQY